MHFSPPFHNKLSYGFCKDLLESMEYGVLGLKHALKRLENKVLQFLLLNIHLSVLLDLGNSQEYLLFPSLDRKTGRIFIES